ncbi:murein transglycosylase C [Mergibacter septicus]|uniref:membrane-bound lytic murein transglycosylase MltC n=1 Tax=Mergibacter septicus TaxID=221402 RepID=UPI00117962F7|nr:membrane-bound lytic murein transglycosylase MltC [Mergibacter septicus]AWX14208.1 murein transglycosylase C [Mergibacter septicus]
MKKRFAFLTAFVFLYGCSSQVQKDITYNDVFSKDTKGLDILTSQFSHNIDQIWGVNELLVASRKDYVKYTDNYLTRSHISFDNGLITVGTLGDKNQLKSAIIHILLMGDDPSGIDLLTSGDTPISNNPFLFGQVLDQRSKPIKSRKEATLFAEYLLKNKLQQRYLQNRRKVEYVVIPMVANHIAVRARKYLPFVRKAARHYGVDESLILGIMEVESSFNPYSVSYANAIGLMQVVPDTAGRDVFKLKGKSGKPSRRYLFEPHRNIDVGTAYLWILQNKYFQNITDPTSRRYAVIAAYNSGGGAVLRIFDNDREKAIKKMDKLLPEQLYQILVTKHPSAQARNYLKKVTAAQKGYRKR